MIMDTPLFFPVWKLYFDAGFDLTYTLKEITQRIYAA